MSQIWQDLNCGAKEVWVFAKPHFAHLTGLWGVTFNLSSYLHAHADLERWGGGTSPRTLCQSTGDGLEVIKPILETQLSLGPFGYVGSSTRTLVNN